MKNKIKQLQVRLLFISGLVGLLSACNQEYASNGNTDLTTKVITNIIKKSTITRYHEIPAVLIAENRADLSFQLSGTVDQVFVKIGEVVKQGQVLMSIYNPNLDPTLASNLADLESVKAQITQVKKDVANFKELRKKNSTSQNALEHKETDLKELLAQEKSINAQIELAQANRLESIIHAPFDSTIAMIDKQLGEFVQSGQIVLTVNQQNTLEVEVNITKLLWDNLKLADTVMGIYQGKEVEFSVVELAHSANNNSHLMKTILQLKTEIKNAIGQQVILKFPQIYTDIYQLPLEVIVDDGINNPYLFSLVDGNAQKNHIDPLYVENNQIIFRSQDIQGEVVVKGQSKITAGMSLKAIQ